MTDTTTAWLSEKIERLEAELAAVKDVLADAQG